MNNQIEELTKCIEKLIEDYVIVMFSRTYDTIVRPNSVPLKRVELFINNLVMKQDVCCEVEIVYEFDELSVDRMSIVIVGKEFVEDWYIQSNRHDAISKFVEYVVTHKELTFTSTTEEPLLNKDYAQNLAIVGSIIQYYMSVHHDYAHVEAMKLLKDRVWFDQEIRFTSSGFLVGSIKEVGQPTMHRLAFEINLVPNDYVTMVYHITDSRHIIRYVDRKLKQSKHLYIEDLDSMIIDLSFQNNVSESKLNSLNRFRDSLDN